ncbi:hypothetical protein VPBG_00240 [Vibrio phage helene 12B3]|uniref:hypothetical protein n=1 Tax=Vibrio phage helene 12B3 TaxID=573173 RepID=UPI0002C15711|nr:hypothetical protein VPBG_00240 [Vibrio phage helene 12B3]YP_009222857.1 hypothetical protein VPLG_00008 [Vibrio phage eugene 12A10]AGG58012.1 hypothetical protein VPBG_00240 [Vibrio phage helene 12B3]AGN51447.1 hypothetical protein VPLG_00008 [Vibrio phage eugene 12A10]
MVIAKCNCGREGRYMMLGSEVMSCNKHALCKPYDQLEGELGQLKKDFVTLLEAADDLRFFRESTDYYKDAEEVVIKFKEKSL